MRHSITFGLALHIEPIIICFELGELRWVRGAKSVFSAPLAAAQSKTRKVLFLDKCPEDWAGGNSYVTGAFCTAHSGLKNVFPLVSNVDEQFSKRIDPEACTVEDFLGDMKRFANDKYEQELRKDVKNRMRL